jgi:hypothetical protein
MGGFSRNTIPNGDGLASLALLRALLRVLHEHGTIKDADVEYIIQEAEGELAGGVSAAYKDALQLIDDLKGEMGLK